MAELTQEAIRELVGLGRQQALPQTVGNTPFITVPNGHTVMDLSKFVDNERADRPIRKRGVIKVFDGESFVEYWQAFSDDNSRVFADDTKNAVIGILDYHEAGAAPARWCGHRVQLDLRHSEEWNNWTSSNGQAKKMTQAEFGEFLETNAVDIIEPKAASMIEMARDLRAKTDVDFGSAITMKDGSVKLKWSETVKGTYGSGDLEVPDAFKIAIPVYLSSPRVPIMARLRYRINSGKLSFWYDLLRHEAIKREAFADIKGDIGSKLQVKLINGVPAQ